MKVSFDVQHIYYLPQYLPVYHEFTKRQLGNVTFVFYRSQHDKIIKKIIEKNNLTHVWVDNAEKACDFYLKDKAHWVFFGNNYAWLDKVHSVSKSVQLGHGVGPKASYYNKSNTPTTVRFVEGAYRTARFNELYPNDNFVDVGFCKLDPLINQTVTPLSLSKIGLDPHKPTLLYAPTFYPSSIECFTKNWPVDFSEYNILIKPHYFSISKSKYKKQRKLLEHWSQYHNVYLASVDDYSLIPFMAVADLLISDASSALFEFAALNKPVVWCDFLKLRWAYKGLFSYRFKKRMDKDYGDYAKIATHVSNFNALKLAVDEQIKNPKSFEKLRLAHTEKLVGNVDGKASKRIIDYILK